MRSQYSPGMWVRLPAAPEWGVGQIQSATGERVTINFEHAGKRLVMLSGAVLEILDDAAGSALGPAGGIKGPDRP